MSCHRDASGDYSRITKPFFSPLPLVTARASGESIYRITMRGSLITLSPGIIDATGDKDHPTINDACAANLKLRHEAITC